MATVGNRGERGTPLPANPPFSPKSSQSNNGFHMSTLKLLIDSQGKGVLDPSALMSRSSVMISTIIHFYHFHN